MTFESGRGTPGVLPRSLEGKSCRNSGYGPTFPAGEDEGHPAVCPIPPVLHGLPQSVRETSFVEHYGRPLRPPTSRIIASRFAVDVSVGKDRFPLPGARLPHEGAAPGDCSVDSPLHPTGATWSSTDFCGSGMTGVAAQWCGTAAACLPPGDRTEVGSRGKRTPPEVGAPGARFSETCPPAATFIAANYNLPFDVFGVPRGRRPQLLREVDAEIGWMYEDTPHGRPDRRTDSTTPCGARSFSCPDCTGEVVFSGRGSGTRTPAVRGLLFPCPALRGDP